MTKLIPEIVEAAQAAFREFQIGALDHTDHAAVKALIDAAREQLGQQAAAPGVEYANLLLRLRNDGYSSWAADLFREAADAIEALAVALPPVGAAAGQMREGLTRILGTCENARNLGIRSPWADAIEGFARTALSTPPVRRGDDS